MYKEKDEVTQNKPVFRHCNLKGDEREHDMAFLEVLAKKHSALHKRHPEYQRDNVPDLAKRLFQT